jgi:hypothetical protein
MHNGKHIDLVLFDPIDNSIGRLYYFPNIHCGIYGMGSDLINPLI